MKMMSGMSIKVENAPHNGCVERDAVLENTLRQALDNHGGRNRKCSFTTLILDNSCALLWGAHAQCIERKKIAECFAVA